MSLREYLRSFFTREYWEALGSLLVGGFFAHQQIRDNFWSRVEEEAEARREED